MRWWPNVTGCATWRWVNPGMSVATWGAARSSNALRTARRSFDRLSISARSHSRMSVATWSLRERAVCSLFPASPTISVRRCSMLKCTSSRSSDHSKRPDRISFTIFAMPRSIAARSAAEMSFARASMRACAREPSMSNSARRLSKGTEALKRRVRPSMGSAKRPDHALPADFEPDLSSSCMEAAAMAKMGNRGGYKSDRYGHPPAEFLQRRRDAALAGRRERAACRRRGDPRAHGERDLVRIPRFRRFRRAGPDPLAGGPVRRAALAACDRIRGCDRAARGIRARGHVGLLRGVAAIRFRPAPDVLRAGGLPRLLRERGHHRLLRPAGPRAVARGRGGPDPGVAGADPAPFPLQQHQRGAVAHPLGAPARRARAGGPRRPLPRAHGRQPDARAALERGGPRAPVPRAGGAAPR